jgi:hypothetical protein
VNFDPDALLLALPKRPITILPSATRLPRKRSFGDMSDYNGFTGRERLRTQGLSKWLYVMGAMQHLGSCEICARDTDQLHAEDYYDLTTWLTICRGCHSSLHQRFGRPTKWQERLDTHGVSDRHWSRLVSLTPFDLANLLRQRGRTEPTYSTFVAVE